MTTQLSLNKSYISFCFFLFINLLYYQILPAQIIFSEGEVYLNKGETISEELSIESRFENPEFVVYKDKNDNRQYYTPTNIKGFQLNNRKFASAIIERETSKFRDGYLSENTEFQLVTDTVFLKYVFEGNKSLLMHLSKGGKENFYIYRDNKFEHLPQKRFLADKSGTKKVVENRKFAFQLLSYFEDYPELLDDINQVEYSQDGLYKLFEKYYEISNDKLIAKTEKENLRNEFKLLAGMNSTALSFSADENVFESLTDAEFKPSIYPIFGIGYEVYVNEDRQKFSFNAELLFSYTKIEGQYEFFFSETFNRLSNYNFQSFYIRGLGMARYNIILKKASSRIFINSGLGFGIDIFDNNINRKTTTISGMTSTDDILLDYFKRREANLLIGAGIELNRLSLELRQISTANIIAGGYSVKGTRYQTLLLLGYRLFGN